MNIFEVKSIRFTNQSKKENTKCVCLRNNGGLEGGDFFRAFSFNFLLICIYLIFIFNGNSIIYFIISVKQFCYSFSHNIK